MRTQLLNDAGGCTYAVIFQSGDEALEGLTRFAREHRLSASHFTALGALRRVVLGYFDWEKKDYDRIEVNEQVEVLALVGDVALDGDEPKIHAHVVVGMRDGSTRGGHRSKRKCDPPSK